MEVALALINQAEIVSSFSQRMERPFQLMKELVGSKQWWKNKNVNKKINWTKLEVSN